MRDYNGKHNGRMSAKIKIVLYITILVIGMILAFDNPDTRSENHHGGEPDQSIELRKGLEFIESRSTVTYKLPEDEALDQIKRMFGLKVKKELLLEFNRHLSRKYLNEKIPKGIELRLFIQPKINQKLPRGMEKIDVP